MKEKMVVKKKKSLFFPIPQTVKTGQESSRF